MYITSVTTLVTNSGGAIRTKHLHARINLGIEAAEEKRIKVTYCSSKLVVARGLSWNGRTL
jgi:hypothetical protein